MKHLTLIFMFTVIISCKPDREQQLTENITAYIKENAKDLVGYEPIITKVTDTILRGEYAKLIIDNNTKSIVNYKLEINKQYELIKQMKEDIKPFNDASYIIKEELIKEEQLLKEYIDEVNAMAAENLLLEPNINNKKVEFYWVFHQCQFKSSIGVLRTKNLYIITDEDYNIVCLDTDLRNSSLQFNRLSIEDSTFQK